ncbi:hypothetical protein HYC85_015396 [Camellia sinensis]|uniref:Uncharacterized protein n=1 Tax=Camellia sinensis TaxID=4442 RepID=A0A7J7H0J5_CAMSI|nr:hypothetical protein HYC85_015396 [Camellia sinensis]
MQHRSSENHSKHHHQHPQMEIVEEYQVFDVMPQRPVVHYAPPYPDVYGSSYGYRKPETHKVILEKKNYESATEYANDGNYRVYGAENNAEADEFVKTKHSGYKVYEEDVDAEADDFIKYEHKKCQLGKSMSMDRF